MLRRSATLRLTLLVALVIAAISLAGLVLFQLQLRGALEMRLHQRLAEELTAYSALYDQRRIIAVRQAMEYRAAGQEGYDTIYVLLDKQGTYLGGNLRDWPAGVAAEAAGFAPDPVQRIALTLPDGGRSEYLAAARELRGGFPLFVGVSMARMQAMLERMWWVIGGLAALMAVAGLATGRWVAGHVLHRLRRINRFLAQVGGHDAAARLPTGPARDEFADLARHVNAMLDRIDRLHQAHQKLGDAIAHELRTPLARIQTKLALLDGDEDEKTAIAEDIRATVRLFDSLLSISAADAQSGSRRGLMPVDLSALCGEIHELYLPAAEERDLKLDADIAPGLRVLGDANLIAQLVSNLVENALKFTAPGDAVRLTLKPAGDRHEMTISDTGPGLPDGLRETLFDAFSRGADKRPGHGLGLALVRAIALRHGARLSLPETGKGFSLCVAWPRFDRAEGDSGRRGR